MSFAITGVWIGLVSALLMFVGGSAALLQPKEKAVALPIAGLINKAFGPDDTYRFVRYIGAFLIVVALCIGIASLAALTNNVILFIE